MPDMTPRARDGYHSRRTKMQPSSAISAVAAIILRTPMAIIPSASRHLGCPDFFAVCGAGLSALAAAIASSCISAISRARRRYAASSAPRCHCTVAVVDDGLLRYATALRVASLKAVRAESNCNPRSGLYPACSAWPHIGFLPFPMLLSEMGAALGYGAAYATRRSLVVHFARNS